MSDDKKLDNLYVVFHNKILPLYKRHEIKIKGISIGSGMSLSKTDLRSFKTFLELNDISFQSDLRFHPNNKGQIGRFNQKIARGFFQPTMLWSHHNVFDMIQVYLDDWLSDYNRERKVK